MKNLLSALLCCISFSAAAGIQVDATRVIYNGSAQSASLNIHNDKADTYMVQTWLDQGDASKTPQDIPLQVIPPVLKLAGNKEAVLRFIYSGKGLPQDRESLFWVNVQEIPPTSNKENVLQIAVRTRIKLFYRPDGLNTSLEKQAAALKWHRQGNQLTVENSGPFNITLGTITLTSSNGKKQTINADMIKPFDRATINLPAGTENGSRLSFSYINDYGGNSEVKDISL
ncbi:fimbrial biogenesis chaperone [Erwinia tasmaniensis]|uniref:Pilus assembly protein, chaperone PapD n=1 Tax=Erwinia tasmaniensis (strain DSM 17950 / CFBP 7177 / CIP 109463 / NCPPB 4357 / Et1/99) TaxID=465817 RepID=B2VH38_ERWT9|nr:molecular chaperone [Erwinia tasmaniensis]CAO95702.1 pilus assembly protein, chaperone PapD [Erwinia tasmaniensis Et1/99]